MRVLRWVAARVGSALLVVVDGMGGHADGAKAAEAAIRAMVAGGAVAEYAIGSRRLKKLPLR